VGHLKEEIAETEGAAQLLATHKATATAKIEEAFGELCKRLEARRQELLKELEQACERQLQLSRKLILPLSVHIVINA
jgi:hypothetical protein